jgi:hypothetical protein
VQPQPLDRLAAEEVALDDLGHVGRRDAAVPDALRVDHHGRPLGAGVEAAGAVGAHLPLQPAAVQLLLEGLPDRLGAGAAAAAARVAVGALVLADEDVVAEAHVVSPGVLDL